jgi:hypothetical protein
VGWAAISTCLYCPLPNVAIPLLSHTGLTAVFAYWIHGTAEKINALKPGALEGIGLPGRRAVAPSRPIPADESGVFPTEGKAAYVPRVARTAPGLQRCPDRRGVTAP